ncbi:MAG: hypothetical protein AAGB48_12560 [Planctomycetota bacterium]
MTRSLARTTTLLLTMSVCLLSACSPIVIRGTVVPGEISVIAVVDADDPRLKQSGITDAKVTIRQTGRSGAVRQDTTGEFGRFAVPLDGTGALSRPMMVEAEANGYLGAVEASMPTPAPGQELLILLQPLRDTSP